MVKATSSQRIIDGRPRKSFFIEMITKDITLDNCILDLVDNSIDAIIRKENLDISEVYFLDEDISLEGYNIDIVFDKDKFEISDNGGGISEDILITKAFRFGSDIDSAIDGDKGLSVYGIGMKRAIFKIGEDLHLKTSTGNSSLVVSLDVNERVKDDDDWTIPYHKSKINNKKPDGTLIAIGSLRDKVRDQFSESLFEDNLIKAISATYDLFLQKGLVITVNGKKTVSTLPKISNDKDVSYSTLNKKYRKEKKSAEIRVITGFTDSEQSEDYGWFVFCNGRLVLKGDKSYKTGWGRGVRNFHSSTNHFIGFVLFSSDNEEILPRTTTKDNIDYDDGLYQAGLGYMIEEAQPVLKYLTRRYSSGESTQGSEKDLNILLKSKDSVPLVDLLREKNFKRSKKFKGPDIEKTVASEVAISYKAKRNNVEDVKYQLGDESISNSKVGEQTFKYFYERECK